MTDSMPLVFVVDDDQDIRTSLSRALGQRGLAVQTFASAAEFLDAYDGRSSACLVLDYGMPGMSGLELQALLNKRGSPLAVVFITGHGGIPESVQAMKGGAIDFLEKPFRTSVLIDRVHTALHLSDERRETQETSREEELVERMLANPAEGSSKELGNALGISPRTVDHHRARILEKLEIRSLVELPDLVSRLNGGRLKLARHAVPPGT